ncbi:GNAT family N-acetyltransferase [Virgibacillus sp. 179-BFC.A HS]|uniref:GNAT family N-acetyltransferase n=1 Tax=Tigheibacillus jepli TaxID=3035914 RepID=A0ABU5CJS6_9BACI|nr:GNAT family N-acetyltransferase [Virgibacillus sp. 179-BFC.A HS]MDY0406490.1 GNAT family N-acetyltransferase [Virgibacillus sp. 179-BFC.A HS]
MIEVNIRPYQYSDEEEVIETWNKCLFKDPVSTEMFHSKVMLDPNFDSDLCLVAEDNSGGKIVGYCLGMVRKYPYEERGMEPERAWIPVMFVHPDYQGQGIGTRLVKNLEERFDRLGKTNITLGAYSPNYFFPGPDKDAYGNSIPFFESLGYEVLGEAVGMDMVLYNFVIPDKILDIKKNLESEHGIRVIPFTKRYTLPLLQFLKENFPGGWVRNIRETLQKFKGEERVLLAVDNHDNIVGYCQRAIDDLEGHFGPFGVSEKLRGKKIGSVLFYEMLMDMYSRGIYHVWLAWTDNDAQRFYDRAGMRVMKRHATMKKFKA